MTRKCDAIYQHIIIQYDPDPETQIWKTAETVSEIAMALYGNRETLSMETVLQLKESADALSVRYGAILEYPARLATFEVSCGSGFDVFPWDVILLSRKRADWTGGYMNAVPFRVLEVNKNIPATTVTITAIINTQTY
jgi:hypothetical protein